MNRRTVSVVRAVEGDVDAVWGVVCDSGNMDRVLPGIITSCRLEGHGPGAVRVCGTAQSGSIEETILTVDDEARVFRYRIDAQTMMPIDGYVGCLHVVDLGNGRVHVLWTASFDLRDIDADGEVSGMLRGMFEAGIQGIGALAGTA